MTNNSFDPLKPVKGSQDRPGGRARDGDDFDAIDPFHIDS